MSYTLLLSKRCIGCDKKMVPRHKQKPYLWEKTRFCSVKCARAIPWNKGKQGLQVAWNKGIGVPWLVGEKHPKWKGKNVGNVALHSWVNRNKAFTNTCEFCGKQPPKAKDGRRRIHLANKSGDYNRDLSDWLWLCVSCHKNYDLARLGKKK